MVPSFQDNHVTNLHFDLNPPIMLWHLVKPGFNY